jgi:hypothetical protein
MVEILTVPKYPPADADARQARPYMRVKGPHADAQHRSCFDSGE